MTGNEDLGSGFLRLHDKSQPPSSQYNSYSPQCCKRACWILHNNETLPFLAFAHSENFNASPVTLQFPHLVERASLELPDQHARCIPEQRERAIATGFGARRSREGRREGMLVRQEWESGHWKEGRFWRFSRFVVVRRGPRKSYLAQIACCEACLGFAAFPGAAGHGSNNVIARHGCLCPSLTHWWEGRLVAKTHHQCQSRSRRR